MVIKSGQSKLILDSMVLMLQLLWSFRLRNSGGLTQYRNAVCLSVLQLLHHKRKRSAVFHLFHADPNLWNEEMGELSFSVFARTMKMCHANSDVEQLSLMYAQVKPQMEVGQFFTMEFAVSSKREDGLRNHTVIDKDDTYEQTLAFFKKQINDIKQGDFVFYDPDESCDQKARRNCVTTTDSGKSSVVCDFKLAETAAQDYFSQALTSLRHKGKSFIRDDPSWPEVQSVGDDSASQQSESDDTLDMNSQSGHEGSDPSHFSPWGDGGGLSGSDGFLGSDVGMEDGGDGDDLDDDMGGPATVTPPAAVVKPRKNRKRVASVSNSSGSTKRSKSGVGEGGGGHEAGGSSKPRRRVARPGAGARRSQRAASHLGSYAEFDDEFDGLYSSADMMDSDADSDDFVLLPDGTWQAKSAQERKKMRRDKRKKAVEAREKNKRKKQSPE